MPWPIFVDEVLDCVRVALWSLVLDRGVVAYVVRLLGLVVGVCGLGPVVVGFRPIFS